MMKTHTNFYDNMFHSGGEGGEMFQLLASYYFVLVTPSA